MIDLPDDLQIRLKSFEKKSLTRTLRKRAGIDFTSNDYLGFAEDRILNQRLSQGISELALGATGSRLLRGNHSVHEDVEASLAHFVSQESALLFPSGFQANLGVLSAVLSEADTVFSDEFNHASLVDGIRLSKACKIIYPHRDLQHLRAKLEEYSKKDGLKVIVTESIFSMDGDQAPLVELCALAQEFSALLIVDEAHATGIFGAIESKLGGGLVQHLKLSSEVFATIHTGGKALGTGGAWVGCSEKLKQYLINFSRPFIFSTAPSPVLAMMLKNSIEHWAEVGISRSQNVLEKTQYFKKALQIENPEMKGPILPFILGTNERAVKIAQTLQDEGFDVRAIRPPTVPENTARLRLTVSHHTTKKQIDDFVTELKKVI